MMKTTFAATMAVVVLSLQKDIAKLKRKIKKLEKENAKLKVKK